MKIKVVAGLLGAGLMLAPFSLAEDKKPKSKQMDDDMARAIAFERYKDVAAARQAKLEARHPSVSYTNADRSVESDDDANRVKDPAMKKK
jgi:hypothetical protein